LNSTRIILDFEFSTSSTIGSLSWNDHGIVAGNNTLLFIFETAQHWNIAFFVLLILVLLYLMIGRNSKNSPD
jgi:hypothetical protein